MRCRSALQPIIDALPPDTELRGNFSLGAVALTTPGPELGEQLGAHPYRRRLGDYSFGAPATPLDLTTTIWLRLSRAVPLVNPWALSIVPLSKRAIGYRR